MICFGVIKIRIICFFRFVVWNVCYIYIRGGYSIRYYKNLNVFNGKENNFFLKFFCYDFIKRKKKIFFFWNFKKSKNFWKVGCDLWNCLKFFKVEVVFISWFIFCFWEGEGERRKKGERKKIELKKEGVWIIVVFLYCVLIFCFLLVI